MENSKSLLTLEIYYFIIYNEKIEKSIFSHYINKFKSVLDKVPKKTQIISNHTKKPLGNLANMAYYIMERIKELNIKNNREILLYFKNETLKLLDNNFQKKNFLVFFKFIENFDIEYEEKFLALENIYFGVKYKDEYLGD